MVYKSFDQGQNWQSIGYPNLAGDLAISDVKFITRDLGHISGTRPSEAKNVYRTSVGGATWTQLNLSAGGLVDFVDSNHGWIMNIGGLGYRTTNAGATWQQFIMPNQGFSPTISKIDFINQNVGWAIGWFGYAAHTTDGGVTWKLQNISRQEEIILGLHVLSESEVYALGVHQAPTTETASLYHTVDAGVTWTRTLVPSDYLNNVFATASGNLWVSGSTARCCTRPARHPHSNWSRPFRAGLTAPRVASTSTYLSPARPGWSLVTAAVLIASSLTSLAMSSVAARV